MTPWRVTVKTLATALRLTTTACKNPGESRVVDDHLVHRQKLEQQVARSRGPKALEAVAWHAMAQDLNSLRPWLLDLMEIRTRGVMTPKFFFGGPPRPVYAGIYSTCETSGKRRLPAGLGGPGDEFFKCLPPAGAILALTKMSATMRSDGTAVCIAFDLFIQRQGHHVGDTLTCGPHQPRQQLQRLAPAPGDLQGRQDVESRTLYTRCQVLWDT
jgi:hypothetical protein